jgi:hypothetical protein
MHNCSKQHYLLLVPTTSCEMYARSMLIAAMQRQKSFHGKLKANICFALQQSAWQAEVLRSLACQRHVLDSVSHLAFFSKPHRRFIVSATAVCFVGGCLQAGADCHEVARPLRPGTLAMVESSGTSGASSQPVSTVTLLTAVPDTMHFLELLWRLA